MSAVSGRAYPAAISLIDTFLRLAQESARDPESRKKFMEPMIYPKGALPDDSPLHVLCYNDTCSFTWTGAEHINQVFSKMLLQLIYHVYASLGGSFYTDMLTAFLASQAPVEN